MNTRGQGWILRSVRIAVVSGVVYLLAACGLGGGSGDSDPTLITKNAFLTGDQETPMVTTRAAGFGNVTVNSSTRVITGGISFIGISPNAAHLYTGAVGSSDANHVATLTLDSATHSATLPENTVLSAAQYSDFLDGKLYVNVHSQDYAQGEIRGQFGFMVKNAILTGAQNVPPSNTDANGRGVVFVDPETKSIFGSATYTGIDPSKAHIHHGAARTNGDEVPEIKLTIDKTSQIITVGNGTLTDAHYNDFLAGRLYFNLHESQTGISELRGQIGPIVMVATLNGQQEVPPVTSDAAGKGIFIVDPVNRSISGGVGFSGLLATACELHTGAAGVGGGAPFIQLRVNNSNATATISETILTQIQFDNLLAEKLYVNVHSNAHTSGEIRGQLTFP